MLNENIFEQLTDDWGANKYQMRENDKLVETNKMARHGKCPWNIIEQNQYY